MGTDTGTNFHMINLDSPQVSREKGLSFSGKADKLMLMLQAQAIMAEYQRVLKFLTSLSPPTTPLCACAHRHGRNLGDLGNLHTALKQGALSS